jgi:hypothetical protein
VAVVTVSSGWVCRRCGFAVQSLGGRLQHDGLSRRPCWSSITTINNVGERWVEAIVVEVDR